MSTELPKIGFLIWVEVAPSTPHYVLTVEDDGRIIVTDTLTTIPDGRGGRENLTEEVTQQLVAEGIAEGMEGFAPGAMWGIVAARPGVMAE